MIAMGRKTTWKIRGFCRVLPRSATWTCHCGTRWATDLQRCQAERVIWVCLNPEWPFEWGKWWNMMNHVKTWWYIMINDETWWNIMKHDEKWWNMMKHDEKWWYIMINDETWWKMMINYDKWWNMMKNDDKLW